MVWSLEDFCDQMPLLQENIVYVLRPLNAQHTFTDTLYYSFVNSAEGRFQQDLHRVMSLAFRFPFDPTDAQGQTYHTSVHHQDDVMQYYHGSFEMLINHANPTQPHDAEGSAGLLSCNWTHLSWFIEWIPPQGMTVICFGFPDDIQHYLPRTISNNDTPATSPFSFQMPILFSISAHVRGCILSFEDLVRTRERQRLEGRIPKSAFMLMHDLARHMIRCSEMLSTFRTVLNGFNKEPPRVRVLLNVNKDDVHCLRSQLDLYSIQLRSAEQRMKHVVDFVSPCVDLISTGTDQEQTTHHRSEDEAGLLCRLVESSHMNERLLKTICSLWLLFLLLTWLHVSIPHLLPESAVLIERQCI